MAHRVQFRIIRFKTLIRATTIYYDTYDRPVSCYRALNDFKLTFYLIIIVTRYETAREKLITLLHFIFIIILHEKLEFVMEYK